MRVLFRLLLWAAPAAALWPYDQPPPVSADELLAQVSARYEKAGDFRADLVVATSSALMDDASSQSGVILARQPNLFRVEFSQPYAQTVIYDGSYMYVVTPGGDQVLRYAGAGFAELVNLPRALEGLREDYDVALAAATAGRTYELHLTAKTHQTLFPKIYLWVDREELVVSRADLYDDAGGTTSYRFSAYRFDVGLPANKFSFTPPPGAEIVDMGGTGP